MTVSERARYAAVVALGAALVAGVCGLTAVALTTDRTVWRALLALLALALLVALLGGLRVWTRRTIGLGDEHEHEGGPHGTP